MKYRGYNGSVLVSLEDSVMHGKIECINDLITYEAESVGDLEHAFQEAVDDYLETCGELGLQPNRPMSGSFNVRIGKELHKSAYLHSKNCDLSLNEFVKISIEEKLSTNTQMHVHLHIEKKHSTRTFDTDFSERQWFGDPLELVSMRDALNKVH